MKINFIVNQQQSLKYSTQDIELGKGICSGMTQDWLFNEMSGTRKNSRYYIQSYHFFSRQRIHNELNWLTLEQQLALRSSPYRVLYTKEIPRLDANIIHIDAHDGFYYVVLYNKSKYGHCIAVSITQKTYRVFDANYGEFECFHENENHSRMKLGKWILEHYSHQDSPTLRIVRLGLK